jgi:hypothetical protein
MRKYKKSRLAMEALIEDLKARGFGVSKNGKSLDPESDEYRKELKSLLESLGPEELKGLCPNSPWQVS